MNILSMLEEMLKQSRMPNAMMLQGAHTDCHAVVDSFLQMACCESQSRCGLCQGCELLTARHHPDIYTIEPAQAGHAIKIEQIRDLLNIAYQTPSHAPSQWIIIDKADSMNINSANALLKILEEPSYKTHFILIVDNPSLLPKTIQSRCVLFQLPNDYLLQAEHLPLARIQADFLQNLKLFLDDKRDLTELLKILEPFQLDDILVFLQYIAAQMIEKRMTLNSIKEDLTFLFAIPLALWWSFWDNLLVTRQQLRKGINYQEQLLLSRLFLILKGKFNDC
jgi:hypothetical protein